MGTRSLTVMQDEEGAEIAVLYRQMDGYPSGHGAELVDFLRPFSVVNGLGLDEANRRVANGADCLAAQIVAHFKQGPGDFYLMKAGTRDCGEEWVYTVQPRPFPTEHPASRSWAGIYLTVQAGAVTFFGLPGTNQANMPVLWEGWVHDAFDPKAIEEAYDKAQDTIPNDFLIRGGEA